MTERSTIVSLGDKTHVTPAEIHLKVGQKYIFINTVLGFHSAFILVTFTLTEKVPVLQALNRLLPDKEPHMTPLKAREALQPCGDGVIFSR